MAKLRAKKKDSESTRETEFALLAPRAQRVCIAGDFNQWSLSLHPLKQDKKGNWRISIGLNPGQYQYRFFVDGEWQNDPNCFSFINNSFGTTNCLKTVE